MNSSVSPASPRHGYDVAKPFALSMAVVPTANPKQLTEARESVDSSTMSDLCRLIWCALIGLFWPRAALEAEVLVLRHQLNVLRRTSPKRGAIHHLDRL